MTEYECTSCNGSISPHDSVFETVKGEILCVDCAVNKPKFSTLLHNCKWYVEASDGKTFNDSESFSTGMYEKKDDAVKRALEVIKTLWAEEDPIEEVE